MAIIRRLIEAIANPYFLILLTLSFLILLLWLKKTNLTLRFSFLLILIIMFIISSGWFVEPMTRYLEDQYTTVKAINPEVRWIVVLSGGQTSLKNLPVNDRLNGVSIQRLIEGLRLYRQLPQAQLLLSGGGYGFEIPEAAHLAELASWFQIPPSNLILETKSINTVEQIKAIKKIVKNASFYLVTSASHMPRAMRLSQNEGLHPIPAPTDFTHYWDDKLWLIRYLPNPHNLFYFSVMMHEYLGNLLIREG